MTSKRSQCQGSVAKDVAGRVWLVVACLCLGLVMSEVCAAESETHAGFLFDQHRLTLESGWRTEAVGPFYYRKTTEPEKLWALPPLFSRSVTYADSEEYDILYPLLTYNRAGAEYRWQLFQLLSFSGGQSQDEIARDRFTIFPFYFQQRSPDSNQNSGPG